jgi:hypothetical protein
MPVARFRGAAGLVAIDSSRHAGCSAITPNSPELYRDVWMRAPNAPFRFLPGKDFVRYLARQAGTRAAARAPRTGTRRLQCACPMPRGTRAAARAPRHARTGTPCTMYSAHARCRRAAAVRGERAEAGAVALAAAATVSRRAVLVRPVPRAELRVGTNTSVHAPRHVARLLSCSVTAVVFAESSFHTSVQLAAV